MKQDLITCAQAKGIEQAISRRGSSPVEVTFADGQLIWYFDNDAAYDNAILNYRYTPTRTLQGEPPKTVDEMSISEMKGWIEKHCT